MGKVLYSALTCKFRVRAILAAGSTMGSALDIKHEQRLKALQKQGGNRHCFVCSALVRSTVHDYHRVQ